MIEKLDYHTNGTGGIKTIHPPNNSELMAKINEIIDVVNAQEQAPKAVEEKE